MSTIRNILFFLGALLLPIVTFAQNTPCNGTTADNGLCNPLSSQFSSIPSFIAGALKVMVEIALPIIAVFIVISGFLFVAARGNSEKLSKARSNFMYVIIGALLILG